MPAGRPIKRDPAHNVELRAIETLIPYARNSRTHSPEQVAQIAASITEWGWTTPVLIDEAGMIIAGHGRVLAARKLGLTDVPVVVATDWTDAKKRAYVIADNKLALNAGWDNELLAVELADLRDVGFDVDLTGFGADELASLVIDAEETDLPALASGDREPLQNMTFVLHDEQAEAVKQAIKKAKELGPFVDTGNENSNGNALARVCELFLGQHDDNS